MNSKKYSLILASNSPRRKEILSYLGIPFEVIPSNILEKSDLENPSEVARELARDKACFVAKSLEIKQGYYPLVLGSDTLVVLGKKIFGKPRDIYEAKEILMELSGKTHQVITGVHFELRDEGQWKSHGFSISSQVTFDSIAPDILEDYLRSGDSLDKAGAYGIQGPSLTFISSLKGSYSNVVGLPLSDVIAELKCFLGISNGEGNWRDLF